MPSRDIAHRSSKYVREYAKYASAGTSVSYGHILVALCNYLCHTVMSGYCNLEVTCWERADLLAFLSVMSSFVFVTFAFCVLGQDLYLIVSVHYLCPLP